MRAAIILNCARVSSIISRAERVRHALQLLNSQSLTHKFVINRTCGCAPGAYVACRVAPDSFDESNLKRSSARTCKGANGQVRNAKMSSALVLWLARDSFLVSRMVNPPATA